MLTPHRKSALAVLALCTLILTGCGAPQGVGSVRSDAPVPPPSNITPTTEPDLDQKTVEYDVAAFTQNGVPVTNKALESITITSVDGVPESLHLLEACLSLDVNEVKDSGDHEVWKVTVADAQSAMLCSARSEDIEQAQEAFTGQVEVRGSEQLEFRQGKYVVVATPAD